MSVVVDRDVRGIAARGVRPLKVGLLGLGTVGGSVARILTERVELGGYVELTHIFNRNVARKRTDAISNAVAWTDDVNDVFAANPDVIVETVGGVGAAGEWVRAALARGISVVTANKMLIAAEGPALLHLAASTGAQLRFEAAVCGGVPVIHAVQGGLAGDTLTSVTGILNGTSNYVLNRLSRDGESMDAVLDAARELGYAEADPSADIDGDDAAAKLVILAGIAFGRHLPPAAIARASIRPITGADFRYAGRLGCTIRQVATVERASAMPDRFHAFVGPALVPDVSAFGRNDGANNVVSLRGCYGGATTFSGAGAGGPATAVAVVSDLLSVANGTASSAEPWVSAQPVDLASTPYYLRFVVHDQPGILADIAATLARDGINVDAVLQEPGYPKNALVFVVTVERCEKVVLDQAIRSIATAPYMSARPLALPMLSGV